VYFLPLVLLTFFLEYTVYSISITHIYSRLMVPSLFLFQYILPVPCMYVPNRVYEKHDSHNTIYRRIPDIVCRITKHGQVFFYLGIQVFLCVKSDFSIQLTTLLLKQSIVQNIRFLHASD